MTEEFGRKEKNKERTLLNGEVIVPLIESAFASTQAFSADGEIFLSVESQNKAEALLRELGAECIEYQTIIRGAKRRIESWVLLGSGAIPFAIGLLTNRIDLMVAGVSSISAGFTLEEYKVPRSHETGKPVDFIDIRRLKEIRQNLTQKLTALGIPKDYQKKNFNKIVKALALKELSSQEEDENKQIRERLGISEDLFVQITSELEDDEAPMREHIASS